MQAQQRSRWSGHRLRRVRRAALRAARKRCVYAGDLIEGEGRGGEGNRRALLGQLFDYVMLTAPARLLLVVRRRLTVLWRTTAMVVFVIAARLSRGWGEPICLLGLWTGEVQRPQEEIAVATANWQRHRQDNDGDDPARQKGGWSDHGYTHDIPARSPEYSLWRRWSMRTTGIATIGRWGARKRRVALQPEGIRAPRDLSWRRFVDNPGGFCHRQTMM